MLETIVILALLAAAAPIGIRVLGSRAGILIAGVSFSLAVWYASKLPFIIDGGAILQTRSWVPSLGVDLSFTLDGLSLVFAVLICGIGGLVLLYTSSYMRDSPGLGRFYATLISFMAAMLGLVLADNMILMFVFWELTSITSFLLIGFDFHREGARRCAWQALVVTGLGGLCLLAGVSGCRRAPIPPGDTSPAPTGGLFEEITERAGIDFRHQLADGDLSNIMESDGAGGVVLDYDGDGWMDLYLVNSGPDPVISDAPPGTVRWSNRLYRNRGDGTFEDRTDAAGVTGYGFGISAAAADYDNDGDTDLFVVNAGSSILYQNQGDGTFRDVTESAGVQNSRAGIAAAFLDVDLDGYLDLFVANYLLYDPAVPNPPGATQPYPGPLSYDPEFNVLFHNKGNGSFEDVSEASGILIPGHRAMSVTPFDFDRDGDQDLYVSNDATANLLLVNDGRGRFRDEALERGVAVNQFGQAGGSMAATVGDADGDGTPDLFITRFERASLYLNSPGGLFEDRILASGILNLAAEYVAWGGDFFDFDNDGDLDLFIANGDPHFLRGLPSLLLENDGTGRFTDAGPRRVRPG